MTKKVAVIALVMVALLSAGCTINLSSKSSPTPMPTPTPTPLPPLPTPIPAATHNPILESAASELLSEEHPTWVILDKKVTWNGGNIVTVSFIQRGTKDEKATPVAFDITLMAFANSQDAAKSIGSIDKSLYYNWTIRWPFNESYEPTAINKLGTPTAYQNWYLKDGSGTTNVPYREIWQIDNIVKVISEWDVGS